MVKSDAVMDGSFGSSPSSSSSGAPVADRQDDLPCQFCSKKFQSQDALEAHLKTKHPFRSSAKLHGNAVSLDAFLGENLKSNAAFSWKIDFCARYVIDKAGVTLFHRHDMIVPLCW